MIKLVIFFALVAAASASPLNPTSRIVGGVDATIEQIPYQVSIQIFSSSHCGGSIISDTWILTAAHCISFPDDWFSVRAGATHFYTGGSVTQVAAGIIHENYGTNEHGVPVNDIALLRLESALTLDSTRTVIPLFSAGEEAAVGSLAVIAGWGAQNEEGSSTTVLQIATIPIVSKTDCNAAYNSYGGINSDQICAALPEGGVGACLDDNGGPLAIDGRLAGVISWGNGCASPGFPGVYTEVAAHRSWISTNSGV